MHGSRQWSTVLLRRRTFVAGKCDRFYAAARSDQAKRATKAHAQRGDSAITACTVSEYFLLSVRPQGLHGSSTGFAQTRARRAPGERFVLDHLGHAYYSWKNP